MEFWHEPAETIIGGIAPAQRGHALPTRSLHLLLLALPLAIAAAGCGHSKSPTSPRYATTGVTAADVSPSPPQGGFPEAGPPQLVPTPSATIVPPPSHLFVRQVPPTFTLQWAPNVPVPGGPTPTRYRYRLFSQFDPSFDLQTLLVRPDSLVRYYAPAFPGWTEVQGIVTQATLQDLVPGAQYAVVVIAMDDHGHFDNVVSFDRNALYFNVTFAAPTTVEDTEVRPHGR